MRKEALEWLEEVKQNVIIEDLRMGDNQKILDIVNFLITYVTYTKKAVFAQFKDVLEEAKRLLDTCDIVEANKYIDKQLDNVNSQLKKELSTDSESHR